ncbi:MAG: AsmA family protein [Sterolibacterium sp.]
MALSRSLQWIVGIVGIVLAPVVLAVLFVAIFGWNWLRAPIERITLESTGRVLAIQGDLKVEFHWPLTRVHATGVQFANPDWAREKQMVSADAVDIALDLPQLLRQNVVFPEVHLERPSVFLERGPEGRKNWLLDLKQQDEAERIQIGRLSLDHGALSYDDPEQKTSIRAELSTANANQSVAGVMFTAQGQYKGLPLNASGSGGAVLALRDEDTPYPLKLDARVGHTGVQMDGSITSLLKFTAVDVHLVLRGKSLEQLFPLLGIAFPATRAYSIEGHLLHAGNTWRYEKFSGRVGNSDIAGRLQVVTGGIRPALQAEMVSTLLDIEDIGPLIGSRQAKISNDQPVPLRVLPDLQFHTDRWDSVDAEVSYHAKTFRRPKELPLEDLATHLSLRDSVLRLDPLDFGLAGGHLNAVISLDGQQDPIRAHIQVKASKIILAKLFPTIEPNRTSFGQVYGSVDVTGKGNSVGRMLASSNGKLGLVIDGGEISKLMMERAGLHLWEMMVLKVSGDKLIKVRCGVADFNIREGTMHAIALIFDTEVTTIAATGSIDLGQETLDLTLNQNTKNTSPLALRSPIYIRGSFARPKVSVDKGRVAVHGLGAIALGIINPLLMLIPMIDAGPGSDSDCRHLIRNANSKKGK